MADFSNSIPAPSANPTFDPIDWLARFEAAGGGWLINSNSEMAFTLPKLATAKAVLNEVDHSPEKREAVKQCVLTGARQVRANCGHMCTVADNHENDVAAAGANRAEMIGAFNPVRNLKPQEGEGTIWARAVWSSAMTRLVDAWGYERGYDQMEWTPEHDRACARRESMAEEIDVWMERLTDERCQAELELIQTPAPSLAATVCKINYARLRWADQPDFPEEWWESILADLTKFGEIDGVAIRAAGCEATTIAPEGGGDAANNFMGEIDALDAYTRQLDAAPHPEGEWESWTKVHAEVVAKVEALPNTPENIEVRARLVWSIIGGDLDDLNDGDLPCHRLVRQIIASLAKQAAPPVQQLSGVGQIAEFLGLPNREVQHLINQDALPTMQQNGAPIATAGALTDWRAIRAAGSR